MLPLIEAHRPELDRLCRTYGVQRLDLFGSATTGHFDPAASDLDFIVRFADTGLGYADRYLGLAESLEAIFQRKVDLLTERSVHNPIFRAEVEQSRQRIYEQVGEQAAA
jgi:predicted nucleotidyltransferase